MQSSHTGATTGRSLFSLMAPRGQMLLSAFIDRRETVEANIASGTLLTLDERRLSLQIHWITKPITHAEIIALQQKLPEFVAIKARRGGAGKLWTVVPGMYDRETWHGCLTWIDSLETVWMLPMKDRRGKKTELLMEHREKLNLVLRTRGEHSVVYGGMRITFGSLVKYPLKANPNSNAQHAAELKMMTKQYDDLVESLVLERLAARPDERLWSDLYFGCAQTFVNGENDIDFVRDGKQKRRPYYWLPHGAFRHFVQQHLHPYATIGTKRTGKKFINPMYADDGRVLFYSLLNDWLRREGEVACRLESVARLPWLDALKLEAALIKAKRPILNTLLGSKQEMWSNFTDEFPSESTQNLWGEVYAIRFSVKFVVELRRDIAKLRRENNVRARY